MTNDETRMNALSAIRHSDFVIDSDFGLRISEFPAPSPGTHYAFHIGTEPLLRETIMPESASPTLEFPPLPPVARQAGAPTVLLTQSITIAGSSSRATLRLEAKSVSRFHCII